MGISDRIDAVIDAALGSRIVGCVILVKQHGKPAYARAAGFFDREAGIPMRQDAIFRLTSVSKVIAATTALAMIERGKFGLDDVVSDFLPYFRPQLADGRAPPIKIRNLLSHTSGLVYDYPDPPIDKGNLLGGVSLEDNLARLASKVLTAEPGTKWQYGMSLDVLGGVIAAVHGGSLGDALAHYVTGPLGLKDTGFAVTDPSRLAVPYADDTPVPRRMRDPDLVTTFGQHGDFSPGRIFNPNACHSGGNGMVSSAPDLMRLFEALRTDGGGILSRRMLDSATANQVGDIAVIPGQRYSFLGALLDDPATAGSPMARGTFWWAGSYGHLWWVDPVSATTIVSLTNTALEGIFGPFPNQIRDAVYGVTASR